MNQQKREMTLKRISMMKIVKTFQQTWGLTVHMEKGCSNLYEKQVKILIIKHTICRPIQIKKVLI
jgi:hypothetical protein